MAFWHAEGRIYQGTPGMGRPAELTVEQAQEICRAYVREFKAAWRIHDRKGAVLAAEAHDELSAAVRAHHAYHRRKRIDP